MYVYTHKHTHIYMKENSFKHSASLYLLEHTAVLCPQEVVNTQLLNLECPSSQSVSFNIFPIQNAY